MNRVSGLTVALILSLGLLAIVLERYGRAQRCLRDMKGAVIELMEAAGA